ncbi:MAG: aromatic ring-hydroxylating dioxygenase subunit alpha [Rhodospirillales bacterium]|nr:aromatic ring-hydroxylating dioxygenase subunit alpha [Rhodospirillales bacterium]
MTMDLAERIRLQADAEEERQGYPSDFPALPPMPAQRYLDLGFFALEQEHIFGKSWLLVGHESDLPKSGSYRKFDHLSAPIFLIRGKDDKVRAFYNTCQHRGAPVIRNGEGVASRLVCAYHAWTYDSQGKLIAVPHEHDFCGLDKAQRGLKEIRCESWEGFLFINLSEEAEPLSAFMTPLSAELADKISGRNLRRAITRSQVVKCNWKIAQEAFLEAYHVPVIHQQTAARILHYPATAIGLLGNGHSRMVHKLVGAAAGASYNLTPLPHAGALLRALSTAYGIFPNVTAPINGFVVGMISFWPVDVETTLIEWVMYGVRWEGEQRPEGYDRLEAAFDMVMQEDYDNLAPMQASVASGALSEVPLCYQERRIYSFNLELDRRIGRERIAPHLRMQEVALPIEGGAQSDNRT